MEEKDKTKALLEEILAGLYAQEAAEATPQRDSYLLAADKQYLGRITRDTIDVNSILNPYGSFGSPYSPTSIFNKYSQYGGEYGLYSPNNPYCAAPPGLFIDNVLRGLVSKNPYLPNRIPTESFLYALRHNLNELLKGHIVASEVDARLQQGQSFIAASDGTFLGNLNPNPFDQDSVFNKFGSYGSQYSQSSIFNPYGSHGGGFSATSPFNEYSTSPPRVYHNGRMIGYLTVNRQTPDRLDPNTILEWAKKNVGRW